jgi:phospholipase C
LHGAIVRRIEEPSMTTRNRRDFLRALATGAASVAGAAAAAQVFPPAIRKALAIPPHRETGTLEDVQHIVILMQENRSFDHYFGTLHGVRGFGDRFPIPLPDRPGAVRKNVWLQASGPRDESARVLAPFRLDTEQTFELMRVEGTPHTWPNAQHAWAEGKLDEWPRHKTDVSLGYYTRADLPFQFALAEAFTISDAYHCSFHGGTNPNRVFAWAGHNDPLQQGGGPVLYNEYDNLEHDPDGGYAWLTYCERLEAAGVSWQIYQNMKDNFTDNPVAGFKRFRDAVRGVPGSNAALAARGLTTRDLDELTNDVRAGTLPQVSWIVATAEGSEHPGPSSPAQGAEYTARVLEALTDNPEVWSKTVLFVMFDENDGFFDHVPPPAVPSILDGGALAGASTVETTGEYHRFVPPDNTAEEAAPLGRPYGLGPRVPLYAISPWSKGGWVHSEVSDHTSLIRFIERRFGVEEPNISPWRRAVCSDLTSAFDFGKPEPRGFIDELPETEARAARARTLATRTTPDSPSSLTLPVQDVGTRPSRPLPYTLHVTDQVDSEPSRLGLTFHSTGRAGAVFHVYDRYNLQRVPRRYTVESGKQLSDVWDLEADQGKYDLWVLGPGGFHRHFVGDARAPTDGWRKLPALRVGYDARWGNLYLSLRNASARACSFVIEANAYSDAAPLRVTVAANAQVTRYMWLRSSGHWYDFTARVVELPSWSRRVAGRVETGRASISDPELGGRAREDQLPLR